MFLKTGHRAADPVYLTKDDGLVGFDQTPGAMNKGGVNEDGKPLVLTLPVGEIQVTEKMMQEERGLIENFFLTPLFKTLMQNPNMTATQVVELINERAMLVAPTLGRQHSEYVGGLVPREIDLLSRMRDNGRPVLPPMPPRLREAHGPLSGHRYVAAGTAGQGFTGGRRLAHARRGAPDCHQLKTRRSTIISSLT